jgi:acetyl esterase
MKHPDGMNPDFERLAIIKIPMRPGLILFLNKLFRLAFLLVKTDPLLRVRRLLIQAADQSSVPLIVFEPRDIAEPAPCLLYFHGGGFFLEPVPGHMRIIQAYACRTPCKVIFVDYRLSILHPFPAGLMDCYHALAWVSENASLLGIDPTRIAVGGESAGGNLAAATALLARDRKGPAICYQMLVYPAIDYKQTSASLRRFADAPIWTARQNAIMWQKYLRNGDQGMLAYASPSEATTFRDLPPAFIETAEFDCLKDEAVQLAARMAQDGVPTQLENTVGTIHGYDDVFTSPIVQANLAKRVEALRQAFQARRS